MTARAVQDGYLWPAQQYARGAEVCLPAVAHERQAEGTLPACRGIQSGHHAKLIAEIEAAGAKVTISRLDVVDPEQAKELIALTEGIAPIAAIFHLAMVLDDRMLINQVPHPLHPPQRSSHHACHAAGCMRPIPVRFCCTQGGYGLT